jgi:hypothetical protein
MKPITLLVIALVLCYLPSFAQTTSPASNNLVGTWMETTDSTREIKIITPANVFFMVFVKDSFAYCGAGTYTIENNKYKENLQYANFDFGSMKGFTYDYNVQGNVFTQTGVLIISDGSKVPINHHFARVKTDNAYNGPQVGTWNQLSSSYTDANGNKASHTNATNIRYQVITPTHWMRISMANNQFENAFGGTYVLYGDKVIANIDYASFPAKGTVATWTQRFEGNKMYVSGDAKDPTGKLMVRYDDVFERVDTKK